MANKPSESIRAFTNNLIDYEGLLPPTELSLSEALDNFLRYNNGDYNWMLSSFVCPAELLPELGNLVKEKYDGEDKIKVTVLGRGGSTEKEFVSGLTDDVEIWKGFAKANAEKIITNTFNVKLPSDVIISHDSKVLSALVFLITELISDNISGSVGIYLEGDLSNKWKKNVKAVIEGIKSQSSTISSVGYRLRICGYDPLEIIDQKQIIYVIRECLKREILMKVTGGLQHPMNHFDESTQTKMFGFLNVFAAGIIAMRHNISDHGLEEIIKNENIENFNFTDEYFSWHNWEINLKDVKYARKFLITSMGSCYFEEAVDGLKSMGLL